MANIRLTPHFTLQEFERSNTAELLGIDNTIPKDIIPNIRKLCNEILEPLREYAGEPIHINSGYRCPRLNMELGGAPHSYHQQGRAVDIPFKQEWYDYILYNLHYKELINEYDCWIHVAI